MGTLGAIVDWADVIAATAVIVSLVFVGLQLRAANQEARFAYIRAQLEAFERFRSRSNEEGMASIIVRGRTDLESLSAEERVIFEDYLVAGIFNCMGMVIHSGRGVLSETQADKEAIKFLTKLVDYPGTRQLWNEVKSDPPVAHLAAGFVNRALS